MRIRQISTALPKNRYSTEELLQLFPCALPEGVRQNILNLGVSKRYLIQHDLPLSNVKISSCKTDLVDLCVRACGKALDATGLSADNIGYYVAAYDANPFLSPGLSHILIRELGLDPLTKHVNIQGHASTAFPKTLEVAGNYLSAHPGDSVLICVSGVNSHWFYNQTRCMKNVDEIAHINALRNDRQKDFELRKWMAVMQFFLFGDGVAAIVVGNNGRGLAVEKITEVTNLRKKDCLAGYAKLSAVDEPFRFSFTSYLDKEIPNLGTKYSSRALDELLGKKAERTKKAVKKWAVHTGSERILNRMAEHHGIQIEKIRESHTILREYGNLAGASLPFILEEIVSTNKLFEGDQILMLGYGWGFSASACLLRLEENV